MPNVDPKQFTVQVRDLGASEYSTILEAMQGFTRDRDENSQDEIWLTEHQPVFTQGQAGKVEHLLAPGSIPVIQSDRGGQVTYHGPGQITAYLLLDLRRHKLGVRDLVCGIEHSIQHLLKTYGIVSQLRDRAPGVYVNAQKIAQLGLRVRRGCSYHGLSLNVDMDLEPFSRINPCGLTDITTTHMAAFCAVDLQLVKQQLLSSLSEELGLELQS
ncbi:MAG: octanoyltransferase [Gammaproteobacteria bacterium]|mgnify:FL=1|jgi:lipoyl(octanoyl) transferase|nr:octanoyltransferase [Gammaproteobacteria bacterium]RPG25374.1 MAG: lipoyl(octanoyl) transferase LipB [Gammaproteobacteria bacterium TMED57]